jgi:hypothetical protein
VVNRPARRRRLLQADVRAVFLRTGGDCEQYVEDGLDFTSAVPHAGRFLLLTTPHYVRRPAKQIQRMGQGGTRDPYRHLPVVAILLGAIVVSGQDPMPSKFASNRRW